MEKLELLESIIEDIKGWEVVTFLNASGNHESYLQVECEEQLLEMDIEDIEGIEIITKEILAEIIINKYME